MGLSDTAPTHANELPSISDSTKSDWLPLFPLQTVLFPQGVLPLNIFEARYLDMISNCMKT
ncbi:MAG: LON peptidase substrate-binding domain-containing protein, partial [Herbaspirillum sp.]